MEPHLVTNKAHKTELKLVKKHRDDGIAKLCKMQRPTLAEETVLKGEGTEQPSQ